MISNLPNVSLERPETNSKLGLSTPESTFFSRPRLAHPGNLKSPLRPTWASQLATFCTDPSYYSVSIRGLSLNILILSYILLRAHCSVIPREGTTELWVRPIPHAVKCLEMQLK